MRNGYVVFVVLVAMMGATRAFNDVMDESISELFPDSLIPRAPGPQVCTDQRYFHCQVRFNRALGFTDDNDFRNPEILAYLVNRILRGGIDGLTSVCNARQQFQQCLGDAYCMSRSTLLYTSPHWSRPRLLVLVDLPWNGMEMRWRISGGRPQLAMHYSCV